MSASEKAHVTAEYLKKFANEAKAIKQQSYRMLAVQRGMRVLDVGCGPAIDTVAFDEAAGSSGSVVGVDLDPKMTQIANQEATKRQAKNITHLVGDVLHLPFDDSEFDRVHAERLLQVLPKAAAPKIFGELQRVLKPGGVMALVDTDWPSCSVNFSDAELERRLLRFFTETMRPNGYAGQQLLELMQNGAFEDVAVEVMPYVNRDFADTPFGDWLCKEAAKAGAATKTELQQWRRELEEKTARHAFMTTVNMVLVAGRKKHPASEVGERAPG